MTATASPRPDHHHHQRHHDRPVEATPPPSRDGSVVMDIGGDIGALVLYTGAELDGTEIDLFALGADPFELDPAQPFVHSAVRPRHLTGGTLYAAVYPDLPAGSYVLAPHGSVPAIRVLIEGGRITEVPR
jgi:hypothetical protein